MGSSIGSLLRLGAVLALAGCGGGGGGGGQTCPAGQVSCDGACIDPKTDRQHCGAGASCQGFAVCDAVQVCSAGACADTCPADQVDCDGTCIDPMTDRLHCGADASCQGFTACGASQVCADGACAASCPTGQVSCGGTCIDPMTDLTYCNADLACQGYTTCSADQVCADGACAAACPTGQVACNGRCIDPNSHWAYCGADASCQGYSTCGSGDLCVAGSCQPSCPGGQYQCGRRCVDPATDRTYCGAASDCSGGTPCGAGSTCQAGVCSSSCATSGQASCGGACVDPKTNRGRCGAAGQCSGISAGRSCQPDQLCSGAACVCPEGQTLCGDGTCQFACASRPGWEWKGSVPLTAPPHFKEPSSVLAHIVFDGTDMVDLTGHTHWDPVGVPGVVPSGMWMPEQLASGPFSTSAYWIGDAATRDYLQTNTGGPFTVCARFKPGLHPGSDPNPNKIIVALGQPEEGAAVTGDVLGGWALMQMHYSACFHYYSGTSGEGMAFSPWPAPLDDATVATLGWAWHCGGSNGTTIAGMREGVQATPMAWGHGTMPPVSGFPAGTLGLPAIGNYSNGTRPLGDGTVYEILITSDPATLASMQNLVARASGGIRLDNADPVEVVGADGATYLAPPSTVLVEQDGSVLADHAVVPGAVLPATPNPAVVGQCWGMDASAADWTAGATNYPPLLRWMSADEAHQASVTWRTDGSMCFTPGGSCQDLSGLAAGRHRFQYCITADRIMRMYVDGTQLGTDSAAISADLLPHLEDPSSSFQLFGVAPTLKLWRLWACAGGDPASCP